MRMTRYADGHKAVPVGFRIAGRIDLLGTMHDLAAIFRKKIAKIVPRFGDGQ
jgi:hypothetical protein